MSLNIPFCMFGRDRERERERQSGYPLLSYWKVGEPIAGMSR